MLLSALFQPLATAQAASADKTLKLYDGFYHEILNEPGKAKVKADIVEWLDKHTE